MAVLAQHAVGAQSTKMRLVDPTARCATLTPVHVLTKSQSCQSGIYKVSNSEASICPKVGVVAAALFDITRSRGSDVVAASELNV